MKRRGWLGLVRTLVIAHALGVAIIGLCRAATLGFLPPFAECINSRSPAPWDQLSEWLSSGCHKPLSALLDCDEVDWLAGTLIAIGVLSGLLVWSIRPIRPLHLRMRLRPLMLVVALVPLECTVASWAWSRTAIWYVGWRRESYLARMEKGTLIEPDYVLIVEVLEVTPGKQPVTGEYAILPDGTIDLGAYGRVKVVGSRVPVAKERIIAQLRPHLGDIALGIVLPPEPGYSDQPTYVEPKDSDRVIVEIAQYGKPYN